MAMACLRLFTVPPFPPLPLFSVPRFRLCIARFTSLLALRLYLRPFDFLAMMPSLTAPVPVMTPMDDLARPVPNGLRVTSPSGPLACVVHFFSAHASSDDYAG